MSEFEEIVKETIANEVIIPTSKMVNNHKDENKRLAFDWGMGAKGCVTHKGQKFKDCMQLLDIPDGPGWLFITESTFLSYDENRNERNAFLTALYKKGHMIGCVATKQTRKHRDGKKSDIADALAIWHASFKHLIIPQDRPIRCSRTNKFIICRRFYEREGRYWANKDGLDNIKKFLPPIDNLDANCKIVFCNSDGKYSGPLMRDLYDLMFYEQPKNREEFEHMIGFYAHGYPCYMRSVIQQRNLIKGQETDEVEETEVTSKNLIEDLRRLQFWKDKKHIKLPWKIFRKAVRKMYAYLKARILTKDEALARNIFPPISTPNMAMAFKIGADDI